MAFDLNKNDGSNNKISSSSKSNSKFDLRKSDPKVTEPVINNTTTSEPKKFKTWIFALIGIIIVLGVWFFFSNSKNTPSDATQKVIDTATKPQVGVNDTLTKKDTTKEQISSGNSISTTDKVSSPAEISNSASENKSQDKDLGSIPTKNKVTLSNEDNNNVTGNVKLSEKVPAAFAKGSSSIQKLNKSVIKEILNRLNKNANETITLKGYASSEGDLTKNLHISELRAIAFKNYLVSRGIPESRIVTIAKGIEDPIASNDTEEGRIQNRRVEFSF